MNRMLYVVLLTASLLTACVVVPEHRVVVAPALPLVVELGVEPYYYYSGYHYYFRNNRWSYATERSGPWAELPRDRYPREVRYKGRGDDHDHDHDRGRGDDRGHDSRERD